MTHIRVHTYITPANPHLWCVTCDQPIRRWHDQDTCGCTRTFQLDPCGHAVQTLSVCPSWSPVDGCTCPAGHKESAR